MISNNLQAFLDVIATSEGTINIPGGDDGYRVLVGSTMQKPLLFNSYSDHPRIYNKKLNSTAAGRYQLLERYFDAYSSLLSLRDFSPQAQDAIAIEQIKERRAMADIESGDIESAIHKCSNIWASFPGNSYGQHQHKMELLRGFFISCGGRVKQ